MRKRSIKSTSTTATSWKFVFTWSILVMVMMSLPCLCGNVLKFEFSGGDVRGCPISVQSSKRLGTQQKSEMPNADEVILVTKDISYFPRTLISICLVWVRYYFQFRWIGECQLWKQWKICPSTNIKFSSMKWISFTTMKCRKYCVIFFYVEVIIHFWVESS